MPQIEENVLNRSRNLVIIIIMSRFACVAPSEDQSNVTLHEVDGKPCFKTCKDISQGTELLVWPEMHNILNEPAENNIVTITEELEESQGLREDDALKQDCEVPDLDPPGNYSARSCITEKMARTEKHSLSLFLAFALSLGSHNFPLSSIFYDCFFI